MATNPNGLTLGITDSDNKQCGYKIRATANVSITAVVKKSTCLAPNAYIYNLAGTLLASTAFSGDTATFSQAITSGDDYYVEAGDGANFFQRAQQAFSSYPINRTTLNYTANSYGVAHTNIGEATNILDIQTTDAGGAIVSNLLSLMGVGS